MQGSLGLAHPRAQRFWALRSKYEVPRTAQGPVVGRVEIPRQTRSCSRSSKSLSGTDTWLEGQPLSKQKRVRQGAGAGRGALHQPGKILQGRLGLRTPSPRREAKELERGCRFGRGAQAAVGDAVRWEDTARNPQSCWWKRPAA